MNKLSDNNLKVHNILSREDFLESEEVNSKEDGKSPKDKKEKKVMRFDYFVRSTYKQTTKDTQINS